MPRFAIPQGAEVKFDDAAPAAAPGRARIPQGADVRFDDAAPAAPPAGDEPGLGEAVLRGGAQGATYGFADELTGALEGAFSGKSYEQARNESRAKYKAAKEAHPIGYALGEILGGAATSLGIGGVAARAAAAGTKAVAGLAAAEGAAQSVGSSESHDAGELLREGATGAAVGGTIGAGLHKLLGGYANTAIERRARHLTQDIGEGAVPTVRRRLGAVTAVDAADQSAAVNVIDNDHTFLSALKKGKKEALAVAEERGAEHRSKVAPLYKQIDQATGGVPVAGVKQHFDAAITAADRPGNDRVVDALTDVRDSFVDWASRKHLTATADGATALVPSQDVREWVSRLLKHSQRSMGGLNETETKVLKDEVHKAADTYLRDFLTTAAGRSPRLEPAVQGILESNRQARVYTTVADALRAGIERKNWQPQSLKDVLKAVGVPGLVGVAAAGGDLISGGLATAGTKLALSAGKKLDRSATRALATLVRAARDGGASEQLKLDTIKAGVPIQLADAVMAQAAELDGGSREEAPVAAAQ